MPAKPFPVVDCDAHIYEPSVIWDQYVQKDYRQLARSAFWYQESEAGPATVIINGRPAPSMHRSRINRLAVWRPGMTEEDIGAMDPGSPQPPNPAAWDPSHRLIDLDAMGVDKQVIFPTLFAEYLPVVENADLARVLSVAYNDWIRDFCAAAPERLFPVAVLPVQHPALAIEELRRVAGLGFKAAFLRPSFFEKRSLNHPWYDGLWSELEALGVAACVHASPGSANPEWTSTGNFVERMAERMQFSHNIAESCAPTMDCAMALTAFAFCGHLERFPRLKLAFIHAGASWVNLTLEKAETYLVIQGDISDVSLEPEHVFFQRPSFLTFNTWESSMGRLHHGYGKAAGWGSRYPHHDASSAWEAIDNLRRWGVPGDRIAELMGGNAASFFGIPIG